MENEDKENLFDLIDMSDLLNGDAVIEPKTPTSSKKEDEEEDDSKQENINDNLIDTALLDAIGDENTENQDDTGEDPKTSKIDTSSSSTLPISILAQALREEGILSNLDDEKLKNIKDARSLVDAFKEYMAENELADLDEDSKNFITLTRAGRAPEAVKQAVAAKQAVEKIDEKVLEGDQGKTLRQQIIYTDLLEKGFTDEKAKKMVKTYVELGDDLEEAKASLKTLKDNRARELSEAAATAQRERLENETKAQRELSELKDKIYKTEEIFKGYKINQTTKDKIFESMTKPVTKDKSGKELNAISAARMKDPTDFDTKLHYLFTITKGFTDLSTITKKEKTTAIKQLDDSLGSTSINQGGTGGVKTSTAKDMLNNLPF